MGGNKWRGFKSSLVRPVSLQFSFYPLSSPFPFTLLSTITISSLGKIRRTGNKKVEPLSEFEALTPDVLVISLRNESTDRVLYLVFNLIEDKLVNRPYSRLRVSSSKRRFYVQDLTESFSSWEIAQPPYSKRDKH